MAQCRAVCDQQILEVGSSNNQINAQICVANQATNVDDQNDFQDEYYITNGFARCDNGVFSIPKVSAKVGITM